MAKSASWLSNQWYHDSGWAICETSFRILDVLQHLFFETSSMFSYETDLKGPANIKGWSFSCRSQSTCGRLSVCEGQACSGAIFSSSILLHLWFVPSTLLRSGLRTCFSLHSHPSGWVFNRSRSMRLVLYNFPWELNFSSIYAYCDCGIFSQISLFDLCA